MGLKLSLLFYLQILFIYCSPVVFVIKNYDTFEAKLVMSTLSPEDEESECQRSKSLVQINSQQKNIEIQRTNTDVVAHQHQENDSIESDSNLMLLGKRNLSAMNSVDFEFSINNQVSMDVLRKKRKTSTDLRDTHLPNMPNSSDQTKPSLPIHIDLESENIDVVFQEDSIKIDAFNVNNNSKDSEKQEAKDYVNKRDHRPKVRQVFNRCFTGNTQPVSYGEILAEASDEEI